MGVNQILSILLPSIGKTIDFDNASKNLKQYYATQNGEASLPKRKLRIAIDINGWISQACHGHGAAVLDERNLTNYGRAELLDMKLPLRSVGNLNRCNSNPNIPPKFQLEEKEKNDLNIKLKNGYEKDFILSCSYSVMSRIEKLKERLIDSEIIVVFDGSTPPVKVRKCIERKENREKALSRIQAGYIDTLPSSSNDDFTSKIIQAAKKTGAGWKPTLYRHVINTLFSLLKQSQICYLVAPYEADSQLAFLSQQNLVDLVVTEDSDLIAYGAKAILFKLNKECTSGTVIFRHELGYPSSSRFSLTDFTDSMLAAMYVAAGCDYCDSLPGKCLILLK